MKAWVLLGIFGLLFLAGCAHEKAGKEEPVNYRFQPPTSVEGKSCLNECVTTRSSCQRLCVADQTECRQKAEKRADFLYEDYVSQCQVENVPVEKERAAFYDDTQCTLQACDCDKDYRACYQLCGGKLIS